MSDLRKAAQDVVTVWKMYGTAESLRGWMEILEAALAQQPEPAQEPVGWMNPANGECISKARREAWERDYGLGGKGNAARFTVPLGPIRAQRPRLTDEEILEAVGWERAEMYMKLTPNFPVDEAKKETLKNARAIERKVRGE